MKKILPQIYYKPSSDSSSLSYSPNTQHSFFKRFTTEIINKFTFFLERGERKIDELEHDARTHKYKRLKIRLNNFEEVTQKLILALPILNLTSDEIMCFTSKVRQVAKIIRNDSSVNPIRITNYIDFSATAFKKHSETKHVSPNDQIELRKLFDIIDTSLSKIISDTDDAGRDEARLTTQILLSKPPNI